MSENFYFTVEKPDYHIHVGLIGDKVVSLEWYDLMVKNPDWTEKQCKDFIKKTFNDAIMMLE
jgi:hypothetical protein